MPKSWEILNLSPTTDKEVIKRAYMSQVPQYNPEENPEGFAALRSAYEDALKEAETGLSSDNNIAQDPISLFLARTEEVYINFNRRCKLEEWQELLQDEACMRLDLEDNTSEALLVFLMSHYYLPQAVWLLLAGHFEWQEKSQTLSHKFPENYIDFIVSSAEYESLNYSLFEGEGTSEQYDRWIWLYYELESLLHDSESQTFEETCKEMQSLPISHPYYDLQLARANIFTGQAELALTLTKPLFEKFPNDIRCAYVYGLTLLALGEPTEAKVIFETLLASNPKDFSARKGVIEALVEEESYEEARELLLKILDEQPYNPFALHVFRLVTEKLADIYEEKHKANPDDMDICLTLAKHHLNVYDYNKCYEVLKGKDYDHPRYYEYMADCYSAVGDHDTAIGFYEKNISIEKTCRNYVKYISALIDANKYSQALSLVEDAFMLKDSDCLSLAYLHDSKGLALHKLKRYAEAQQCFDDGLAINKKAAHIYIHKAKCFQDVRRFAEAIDCCESSLAIFPYTTDAYVIPMEIYYDADMYENMLAIAEKADQVGFDSPKVRYHKACALRMLKRPDDAREILTELFKSDFDEGYRDFFHVESAYLAISSDNYNEALEHITKAIDINADYPYRFILLGNVYRLLNRYKESLEIYDELLGKFADFGSALIGRADVYFDMGNYTLACKAYQDAAKANTISAQSQMRLAYALSELQCFDEAIEVLDESEKEFPEIIDDIVLRRGLIFYKLGRFYEALEELLKVVLAVEKAGSYWNSSYIYTVIGLIYSDRFNDGEQALKYFEMALKSEQTSSSDILLRYMGDVHFYFYNNCQAALIAYDKCIALEQDNPEHYIARAYAYRQQKSYIRANREFKRALKMLDEDSAHGKLQIAFCYVGLRMFALARTIFYEILEHESTESERWSAECYYGLGLILERKYRYRLALEMYEKAKERADSVRNNWAVDRMRKRLGLLY